jgi:AraC-like DNA-binding protein
MEKSENPRPADFRGIVPNFVATDGLVRPLASYFQHAHPWWEITFYTSGEGTLYANGREIPFRPGTVACIPPRTAHREEAKTVFLNRWVAVEHVDTPNPFPVFQIPPSHPVYSLISLLYVESRLAHRLSELVVRHLFDAFMIYLQEWLGTDAHERIVTDLKRRIIGGMRDPAFRVHRAMTGLPMAADHLRRIFRERVGTSPKHYLTGLRMERAKELLRMGSSVKQVAAEVGFADPYHFSREFRRTQGVSPSGFQEPAPRAPRRPARDR